MTAWTDLLASLNTQGATLEQDRDTQKARADLAEHNLATMHAAFDAYKAAHPATPVDPPPVVTPPADTRKTTATVTPDPDGTYRAVLVPSGFTASARRRSGGVPAVAGDTGWSGALTEGQATGTTLTELRPGTTYDLALQDAAKGDWVTVTVTTPASSSPPPVTPPVTTPPVTVPGAFAYPLSGASGDGMAGNQGPNGKFGRWRGTPCTLATTWQATEPDWIATNLRDNFSAAAWRAPLYHAIGGLNDGETFAQFAAGAYDDRLRQQLQNLKDGWGDRTAAGIPLFAAPFHEWNGTWYPWSVNTAGTLAQFVAAWRHWYALKQEVFPQALATWVRNKDSSGQGFNSDQGYPGSDAVDVCAVDYYNQFNQVDNDAQWNASMTELDGGGAKGLETHRQFALKQGKPLLIPEWGCTSQHLDSGYFVTKFLSYCRANAGSGPGQIIGESYFNVKDSQNFWIFAEDGSSSPVPKTSAAYAAAF